VDDYDSGAPIGSPPRLLTVPVTSNWPFDPGGIGRDAADQHGNDQKAEIDSFAPSQEASAQMARPKPVLIDDL